MMTIKDLERLRTAGLYDPSAVDAERQRALLEELVAGGLTVDEITAVPRLGPLALRLFERLLRPGPRRSTADAAARTGLPLAMVQRIWRAWGFPGPSGEELCWTDGDIDALDFVRSVATIVGPEPAFHAARTMGMALSRIAEAEIALMRARLEAPLRERQVAGASILVQYRDVIEMYMPAALRAMEAVHRHHVMHVAARYTAHALSPSASNVLDVVVGFADLTGSTALVQRLDLADHDHAIARFEEITTERIVGAGATLAKHLGDGVMFVADVPVAACRLALDLVAAFSRAAGGLSVRVGLAAGRVAALRGDFFGPAVHQAARIVAVAAPETVVASDAVRVRCARDDAFAFAPLGAQRLHGFEDAVELFRLTPGARAAA